MTGCPVFLVRTVARKQFSPSCRAIQPVGAFARRATSRQTSVRRPEPLIRIAASRRYGTTERQLDIVEYASPQSQTFSRQL